MKQDMGTTSSSLLGEQHSGVQSVENGGVLSLIREAKSHLDGALIQSVASDDQIIIGHMRSASQILRDAVRLFPKSLNAIEQARIQS